MATVPKTGKQRASNGGAGATKKKPARRRRRKEAPEKAGQLKPADPFDLIRLLARSQHDPRKAVAELVQNSLDAGARHVLVTRFRHRGTKMLSIRDDGSGVLPDLPRREALTYIATHIGHSRKRDLSVQDRYRLFLQGKYGIGLLGFWSVGKVMEMRTKVGDELALMLRLKEDSPRYEVLKDRRELELSDTWTEVLVSDLHDSASRQLVGRRLADFLAEELRGQLLQREVDVRVIDRLARGRAQREFRVVPPRFKGVPLDQLTSLRVTGHRQPARVQLHYLAREHDDPGRVSLFANGTLVVEDLSLLEGFDHPPWTSGQLVGMIDFAGLDVAPGTRRGFVPNAAAEAFARALPKLERPLLELLERFDEERRRERDVSLVKQLRRLFRDFGRRMPHFDLFDVQTSSGALALPGADSGAEPEQNDAAVSEAGGEAEAEAEGSPSPLAVAPEAPSLQSELFLPGPLHSLELVPREPMVEVLQSRTLRVVARDLSGRRLTAGVELEWSLGIGASLARLTPDLEAPVARFEAGAQPGLVEIELRGTSADGGRAELTAAVEICEDLALATRPDLGIPEPTPVHAPGERWRSRMLEGRWEYNAGHPDYLAVVESSRRKLRYIASLLAKEVVLRGHPNPEVDSVLERMLQVLAWVERRMSR